MRLYRRVAALRQPRRGCRGHIPQYFGWGTSTGISPPILLRTCGYNRPILVALHSLRLKPISFGYKTPPIRFSQAGGQSAHKARPPNLELALTPLCCWHAGEDGQLLPLSCVYPLSRRSHDMPIVVVRSHEHDSTGSTVDTFLPQGDLTAAYEAIPLPTVHEDLSDD